MKTIEQKHRELLERNSCGSLLPVLAYEDATNTFYLDDGYIGQMFLCAPLPGIDESVEKKLSSVFAVNYPDHAFVQIMLWASPDIYPFIESFEQQRDIREEDERGNLLRRSVESRKKLFIDATSNPISARLGTRIRTFHVIVTVKIPFSGSMPDEKDVKQLGDVAMDVKETMRTVGMGGKSLDANEYLHIMRTMVNWSDDAQWKAGVQPYNDNEMLRDQVFDYDNKLSRTSSTLHVKNKVIKTLSVRRWPKYIHLAHMQRLIGDMKNGNRGIRDNFLYTLSVYFPPRDQMLGKLETKKQAINYQSYGPLLKWVPKLALQKESYDALFAEIDEGGRPLKAYLQFTLFCDDEESATKSVANMKTFFRETSIQVMEDPYMTLPIFLNGLPFGPEKAHIDKLKRYQTMTDTQALHLMPVVADWKGTGTPLFNLTSRNGELMTMDLFDSDTNYNAVIAAQSGSGKSVFANEMMNAYLSIKGRVWVIDVGRSYEKLCNVLKGDFIVFSPDKHISLNPFPLVDDFNDQADMLVDLISVMASMNGTLSELQVSKLREIMRECWESEGKDMTVSMIADRCKGDADPRVNDMGTQLYNFTTKGEYGQFFSGPNTIDFRNRFTVLELEELKGRKHLQQVILLQLISQIQHSMYLGNINEKKVVFMDESWDLLTQGDTAKFIETGYRRFRKYNGSAVAIMQSVNDLYSSPSGRAIAENSANLFLLGQKAETIEELKKTSRLALSDWSFEQMKSVHTVRGHYSECFCYTPNGQGIGRLILDRFHQLLYSTLPNEVHMIRQLCEAGLSTEEAIMKVIEQERNNNDRNAA